MNDNKEIVFTAFTKPWITQSLEEIAKLVSDMGLNGIEFSLREGYQIEPYNALKGLPELVKIMTQYGVKVTSIASNTDENIFAACEAANIPIIRILATLDLKLGYWEAVDNVRRKLEKIIPLCEKYNVKIGVQHHFGPMISHSMELYQLIKDYDPRYVGAIWDSAQSILAGEEPEQGLDIIWDYLCLVNLKNVFYKRTSGPEDEAKWERYFTTGKQGLSPWPRVIQYLKNRGYEGPICLTHEYTNQAQVNKLLAEDVKYAKFLFNQM